MPEGNEEQRRKPSIDECIAALTMNLEMAERHHVAWEEKVRKLEVRERQARLAEGIRAYLKAGEEQNGDAGGEK